MIHDLRLRLGDRGAFAGTGHSGTMLWEEVLAVVSGARPRREPNTKGRREYKRMRRPAKGTGASLLEMAGAWGYMSREEIDQIKRDIFGSRRSSK